MKKFDLASKHIRNSIKAVSESEAINWNRKKVILSKLYDIQHELSSVLIDLKDEEIELQKEVE